MDLPVEVVEESGDGPRTPGRRRAVPRTSASPPRPPACVSAVPEPSRTPARSSRLLLGPSPSPFRLRWPAIVRACRSYNPPVMTMGGGPYARRMSFGGLSGPHARDLLLLVGVLFATFSLQFFETLRFVPELMRLSSSVWQQGMVWQLLTYPGGGLGRAVDLVPGGSPDLLHVRERCALGSRQATVLEPALDVGRRGGGGGLSGADVGGRRPVRTPSSSCRASRCCWRSRSPASR